MTGLEGLLTTPDAVAAALLGSLGDAEARSTQLWRETSISESGEQFSDLYMIDERGVSEVAAWGGPIGFIFDPALTMLPSDVEPGAEWSSSGSALPGDVLTYRSNFRATDPPPVATAADGTETIIATDCIQVHGTVTIEQPGAGVLVESVDATIWCPGTGRIFSSGRQNEVVAENVRLAAGARFRSHSPIEPPPEDTAQDRTVGVDRMQTAALRPIYSDPFFGDSAKNGSIPLQPSITSGGLLVVANGHGDDVQAWQADGEVTTLEWSGHPGGVIVALSTVGDFTLVATSERKVHAYDGMGRRQWTWQGDELALAPVVAAAGQGTASAPPDVIIVTRDGRVTRIDGDGGRQLWSAELGADARGSFVVNDGMVVVADERGRVNGIDAVSGRQSWRNELGVVDFLASATGGPDTVYAVTAEGDLVALDAADGTSSWSVQVRGGVRALVAAGDVVIAAGDEELAAYLGSDGRQSWSAPGADEVAILVPSGLEPGILSLRERTVSLHTLDGRTADEWQLGDQEFVAENHLVTRGDELLVVDSYLAIWRIR